MPTWNEVSTRPDYLSLPDIEKKVVAGRFWNEIVTKRPDFVALPDTEKQVVQNRFSLQSGYAPQSETPKESFLSKIKTGLKESVTGGLLSIPEQALIKGTQLSRGLQKGVEDLSVSAIQRAKAGGYDPNLAEFYGALPSVASRLVLPQSEGELGALIAAPLVGKLVGKSSTLVTQVANRIRLLKTASQAVREAEMAAIQKAFPPKVFNEALNKAATPEDIARLSQKFQPIPAQTSPKLVLPQRPRATQPPIPRLEEWMGAEKAAAMGYPISKAKPFTLQAGLADKNRAALEAFRARLPQGPAIPPRMAQEAVSVPKPPIPPVTAPVAPQFAGNIRLGKYSPEAQQGIIAANKLTGVAERTPTTIAEMKITGATPAAQEVFSAVAKGESGALAGKTQLVREALEKEAAVFAEQADLAVKAGGDNLDNLIKTSPVFQTAEQVSKVAQASGQTLAIFRQNASTALGKATVSALEKIKAGLKASKSPFAQKKIEAIEALQKALNKKELALAKLPAAYRKVMEVTDKAYSFWINSILSNPLTHLRNIGGNTLFLASKPIEKIMAASVDNALSIFTGKAPGHTFREAGQMIKAGAKYMIGKGEKLPFDPTKAGFGKLDRPIQDISGKMGKVIGAPTKALEVEDNIAKNMVAQMEYAALKSKGVAGDELTKRVMDEAAYRTYQDEAGDIVKWIMKGRDKVPGFRWVIPFVRTPAKLLERGLERTPLGVLKVAGKAAKGAYKEAGGQAALATDIGNTILGSSASAFLAMEYGKGNISGAWPTDRRESERWKAEGKKPYSYRTKDGWVALDKIEPFGTVVKTTIVTLDTFKNMAGESMDKAAMAASANLGKELVKMSAFNGFTNFTQSISDPARFAPKTAARIASGFVPGASKFAADSIPGLKDPLMRQKEGAVEMVMGKIPFLSERLKPQLDIWGGPIGKEAFFTAVSRARESKELDLLKELDLPVPKYPTKMFGYDFTRDEAFNIHQKAGPIIKDYLMRCEGRDIVNSKAAKAEIRAGIDDIKDAVAQLEVLKIPFTPTREQADSLSTIINTDEYRKRTPDERRARLNRFILLKQRGK